MRRCLGTRSRTGESNAPVRSAHVGRGPKVEPLIEVETNPLLLNWRKLVCASALKGLPREIAAGSEVLELTDNHVLLAPLSNLLINHEVTEAIRQALKHAVGHDFEVKFTQTERNKDAVTLSLLEESERRAARIAMIEAFKSDPFVQQCLETFGAVVDETSVTPKNK